LIYPAKRARWCVALIGAIGILLIGFGVAMLAMPAPSGTRGVLLAAGVVLVALGALFLWALSTACYEITPSHLVVKFGPIRPRFALEDVAEAVPTKVPLGPALSFVTSWDMVYIRFRSASGRGSRLPLVISPSDQATFLRELAQKAPGMRSPHDRPATTE
jgi:hypothetical protein